MGDKRRIQPRLEEDLITRVKLQAIQWDCSTEAAIERLLEGGLKLAALDAPVVTVATPIKRSMIPTRAFVPHKP